MADDERRPTPSGPGQPTFPPGWRSMLLYVAVSLLLLWGWQQIYESASVQQIPYSRFKKEVERGTVREVVLAEDVVEGIIDPNRAPAEGGEGAAETAEVKNAGAKREPFAFRAIRVEDPDLIDELMAHDVEVVGRRPGFLSQLLWVWLVPMIVILFLISFIGRRVGQAGRGMLNIGRSRARLVAENEVGVTFDDVAGCDEAKAELQEVVDFLRHPDRYREVGARMPKGVLLVGPPGTGKTLMARAVAGEAGVPFYQLSGSDFVEMFVGVGAARVRDLFEQAKKSAPCIVFIDELDAVGRQRGVHVGAVNDEREQTLNALLVEMDGFEPNSGVVLLAATNRPDVLDAALLRPGRFDRQVVIDAPDLDGRLAILRVHARKRPLAADVDLEAIARATPGFSGADLANVLNEASLLAVRRGGHEITQSDLEEAIEKVVAGPERRSRRLAPEEKRRVAYHEVGHALVARHCEHADPVHKISIVPRGRAALGYTIQRPEGEHYLRTRAELVDKLRGLLGGRAAEELVFGEISTGARDDLQKATQLARRMVTMFGMSERVGLAHCGLDEESPFLARGNGSIRQDCSDETARAIDAEVRALLDDAYDRAHEILRTHRAALDRIAGVLLEREMIDAATFEKLAAEAEETTPTAAAEATRVQAGPAPA